MKINDIKINAFGKLINKKLAFNDGINLIIAKNESGKSTLVAFIQSMLFGISRTKNGKAISDFDKYKPWNSTEFSGKISYSLDSTDSFEVFRDFSKKQNKVFDSNLSEISSSFSIDKAKGPNFISEQTNITEDLFYKTAIIYQQEAKLNLLDQNIILQKISNLVSTGDDTISFKKLMDKLNKKQLDEVGTSRSNERPINLITSKITNYKNKLEDIENIKGSEDSLKSELNSIDLETSKIKKQLEFLKEVLSIKNNERVEYAQITAIEKFILEYSEKINNLQKVIDTKSKPKSLLKYIAISLISFVIFTISIFIFRLDLYLLTASVILLGTTAIFAFKNRSNIETYKLKLEQLNKEIRMLTDSKIEKQEELNSIQSRLNSIKLSSADYIRNKYEDVYDSHFINMSYEDINLELNKIENLYSDKKIQYNTSLINLKNISSKIDDLANIEEELLSLEESYSDLMFLNNSLEIAMNSLEEAYEEIKNNITPTFVKNLSTIVSKISNNRYSNIKFDDAKGIIVESESGDYINSDQLSIGTIDQMYIALRLSALKEISAENIPLFLDESFVYFDDERLANILKYISEEFKQVIFLSCSDREMKILEEMNISFNKIILD